MKKEAQQLLNMIEQAEWEWDNLPHAICPKCGTEVLQKHLDEGTHTEFICKKLRGEE